MKSAPCSQAPTVRYLDQCARHVSMHRLTGCTNLPVCSHAQHTPRRQASTPRRPAQAHHVQILTRRQHHHGRLSAHRDDVRLRARVYVALSRHDLRTGPSPGSRCRCRPRPRCKFHINHTGEVRNFQILGLLGLVVPPPLCSVRKIPRKSRWGRPPLCRPSRVLAERRTAHAQWHGAKL